MSIHAAYRKLLDCQNEEVVERVNSQNHPLFGVAEVRELRIRRNPSKTTTNDVLFLLHRIDDLSRQLDEARTVRPLVARPESSCAVASAINVEAWLASNQRPSPSSDWITMLDRPYFPPV